MIKSFKEEFEKKIIELGFSYSRAQDGLYYLCDKNGINHPIIVLLIESQVPNNQKYGSKNRNDIQAIGIFIFKRIKHEPQPDFFIFSFSNLVKEQSEYLIIPTEELEWKIIKRNLDFKHVKRIKIVLWLMNDGSIYNTTGISIEGEWYLLSKGINGRMVDKTDMDYTKFFNNWPILWPSLSQ
ncbi:MAG: hypothetical protein KA807_18700 [Prolixibacteraceae bacterium]|nr:hypothetical protein [Prolixibacteraceae bacterium]